MKRIMIVMLLVASQANGSSVKYNSVLNIDPGGIWGVIGQSAPALLMNRGCTDSGTFEDFSIDDNPIPSIEDFLDAIKEENGFIFVRSHGGGGYLAISFYQTFQARNSDYYYYAAMYPGLFSWYMGDYYHANTDQYVYGISLHVGTVSDAYPNVGRDAVVLMGCCYGGNLGPDLFPRAEVVIGSTEPVFPQQCHLDYNNLCVKWLQSEPQQEYPELKEAYDACFLSDYSYTGNEQLIFAPRYRGFSFEADNCDRFDETQYPRCVLVPQTGLNIWLETIGEIDTNRMGFSSSDFILIPRSVDVMDDAVTRTHILVLNWPRAQGTGTLSLETGLCFAPDSSAMHLDQHMEIFPMSREANLYNTANPACLLTRGFEVINGTATFGVLAIDSREFLIQGKEDENWQTICTILPHPEEDYVCAGLPEVRARDNISIAT